MMGISKRELLNDYYPDELAAVLAAWADMHSGGGQTEAEPVEVQAFLEM